jgi:hypothetical protein
MKILLEKLSMFNMQVIFADQPEEYPREGDKLIMQALIHARYTNKALWRLHRV